MAHALALSGRLPLLSGTPEGGAVLRANAGQSDAELMQAHLDGDNAAFGALFDRHHMRLYLYCARMLSDTAAAEDVMQEVWERVVRLRERPMAVRQPSALLFTMARRLCLNQIRGARRFTQLEEMHQEVGDEVRDDLEEMAVEALGRLPLPYREVLALNIYSGYGLEEMAPMLGISAAAVWKRASRARTMLRQEVEKMMAHDAAQATRRGR